jgi:hypothetical protein
MGYIWQEPCARPNGLRSLRQHIGLGLVRRPYAKEGAFDPDGRRHRRQRMSATGKGASGVAPILPNCMALLLHTPQLVCERPVFVV